MITGRTSSALTAVLLAAGMTLPGCSSSDDEKKADVQKAGQASSGSGPRINTEAISPPDLVTPPVLKPGFEGARKDVTIDKCEAAAGPQTVKVKITSTAKETMDYLVTINWVNGSDVMGRGYTLVRGLEPGQHTESEVKATITRKTTACTVNVVRGTVDETSLGTTEPSSAAPAPAAPATPSAATPAATVPATTTLPPAETTPQATSSVAATS